MRRRRAAAPRHGRATVLGALALAASLFASCGGPPELPPHGLAPGPLADTPSGEAFAIGSAPAGGRFVATVETRFEVARAGHPTRAGSARLSIEASYDAAVTGGGRGAQLTLRVLGSDGVGAEYVAGLDGLTARLEPTDRAGAPVVRFLGPAPKDAERLFRGLWLCGFGDTPRWWPARPVRVGGVVPRAELGGLDLPEARALGVDAPRPRARGGVRVEGVDRSGHVALSLDALVEVDGVVRAGGDAASLRVGVLTKGTAEVDRDTGLPLTWRYEEHTRLLADDGRTREDLDQRQTVEGEVHPLPPRDPGDR